MLIINNSLGQLASAFTRTAKPGAQRYIKIDENHGVFTRRRKERSSLKEVFEHAQKQIQDAVCCCSKDDIEKTQKALNKISLATETLKTRYAKRAGNLFVRLGWIKPREKRETLESADQLLNKVQTALHILSKIDKGNPLSLKEQFEELFGGNLDFTLQLLKSSEKGEAFESCRQELEEIATEQFLRPFDSFDRQAGLHYNRLHALLPYINYNQLPVEFSKRFEGIKRFEPLVAAHKFPYQPKKAALPVNCSPNDLPIFKKIARDFGNRILLIQVYLAEKMNRMDVFRIAFALNHFPKRIRKPAKPIDYIHIRALHILIQSGLLQNEEFRRETNLDDPLFRDLVDLGQPWTSEDFLSRALLHVMKALTTYKEAEKLLKNILDLERLNEALSTEQFTMQDLESLHQLVQKGLLEDKKLLDNLPLLRALFSSGPESVDEYNLEMAALHYIYQAAKLNDLEKAKNVWQAIFDLKRLNDIDFDYIWGVDDYRSLIRLSRSEVIKEEKFVELFGGRIPLLMTLVKQGNYKPLPASIPLEPDFKLCGKDGDEVMAILPLMAMVSQYFEAMLNNPTLGTNADFTLVRIEKFKGNLLSHIVEYAETGTLPAHLSDDELFILKQAAEYFTMPKLSDYIDSIVQFIDQPDNTVQQSMPKSHLPVIEKVRHFSHFPPGIKMGNLYMTYREVRKKQ